MDNFSKKTIVITGAAQGVGRELAQLFAGEGANLALIDINEALLKQTKKELAGYHVKVLSYGCDLASADDIENVANKIKSDFNQVDILINNAGVISGKYIWDLSYEDIRKTIDVNLVAVIMMTKQFLKGMMERNSGYIVNMSSVAGLIGAPRMGDYSAAKHGVNGFSDTLRLELKKKRLANIKITVVCPSLITTGMFEGFKTNFFSPPLSPKYVAEQVIDAIKKETPYVKMPRFMKQLNLLKALPTNVSDYLLRITGATSTMDVFKGRK